MFVHLLWKKDLFVHLLSTQERTALVHTFAYLAHLDHKLHQTELDLITMIAHHLGLDPQIIVGDAGTVPLEEILKPVEREQAKRIILQELINLAYADGDYSQEERAGMQHIADILDIDVTMLGKIEDWVKRGRDWKDEGVQLILEGR